MGDLSLHFAEQAVARKFRTAAQLAAAMRGRPLHEQEVLGLAAIAREARGTSALALAERAVRGGK